MENICVTKNSTKMDILDKKSAEVISFFTALDEML